ncbi:hypothetical protein [Paenibacillus sp. P22]|uniref:hypothetical protein n=1 Tax=Paenibacillus sp. P22 TaxID=483908 RepID=UPI00038FB839|nr:hypothetical protein [Paenibacillus sp. P22]CDN41666.1 hypothetical protein BN871_AJ_00180 [Paenibacillus sp. P22]
MSDEQPVALCDHTGCFARATTRGMAFGPKNKDGLISVNACSKHSQQHGFIDLKEVPIPHE